MRRLPLATDGARREGRLFECAEPDVVGIRERLLVAVHRANPDAAVDRERARLHDAFLEAPALRSRVLEIEVGEIDVVRVDRRQHAGQMRVIESGGCEQQAARIGHQRAGGAG